MVVVSIGFRCMTSLLLRHFGLQQESLPFDWLGASLSSITAALADDLQAMLTPEDIQPFLNLGSLTEHNRAVTNKYGMVCTHVFKKQLTGAEQETAVLATAHRRAERLLSLLRGEDPVIFVRHQNSDSQPPSYEEWQAFVTTIRSKYPHLLFHVLYVHVGSSELAVPPEVKVLVGDYPIIPIGGKFDHEAAQCPLVVKHVINNLYHRLLRREVNFS
jgi:Putative papain-like cysteine peptidase (DUF1796)